MKYLVLFLTITFSVKSYSQTYWVPKTPLLDFLYKLKRPIPDIFQINREGYIPIVGYDLINQKLIKTKNSIYIIVEGTGQVYKATDTTKDSIAFTRNDITKMEGYNCDAIWFAYRDTIFSYGGYGFWRYNGQLRYFRDNNEWFLTRLNKEFEISSKLYFYSEKNQAVYSLVATKATEVVYDNHPKEPNIIKLDLVKKRSEILGKISLTMSFTKSYKVSLQSLNLLMVDLADEAYLLDLENNIVYKNYKKNEKYEPFVFLDLPGIKTNIFFELDNKIYYSYDLKDSLHTFEVSMNDFKKEPYPIYSRPISWVTYTTISFILVILISLLYFIIKRKSKRKELNNSSEQEQNNQNGFTALEKELIYSIVDKSNKNLPTSVEELNTILGISKKPLEYQKRIRTETITQINSKFKELYQQESDFIERTRGEEDKRFFNYIIRNENIKIIEKWK